MTRDDPTNGLLGIAINPTVTLYIAELRRMDPEQREETRTGWADRAATAIASGGDSIMYRGRGKGETARNFDMLARGLAAAAWQPGGVSFAGNHWCTEPHDNCPNRR